MYVCMYVWAYVRFSCKYCHSFDFNFISFLWHCLAGAGFSLLSACSGMYDTLYNYFTTR